MECCFLQFLGMQCLANSVKQGLSSKNRLGYSTHNRLSSLAKRKSRLASCTVINIFGG
jgi:hypothetical protein